MKELKFCYLWIMFGVIQEAALNFHKVDCFTSLVVCAWGIWSTLLSSTPKMLLQSDMARVTAKCPAGWHSAEQPFTFKKVIASVRVLEGDFCSTSSAFRSYQCLLLQEPLASWKDPLWDSSAISSDYLAITMTKGPPTAFPCWQVRFSHCSMTPPCMQ